MSRCAIDGLFIELSEERQDAVVAAYVQQILVRRPELRAELDSKLNQLGLRVESNGSLAPVSALNTNSGGIPSSRSPWDSYQRDREIQQRILENLYEQRRNAPRWNPHDSNTRIDINKLCDEFGTEPHEIVYNLQRLIEQGKLAQDSIDQHELRYGWAYITERGIQSLEMAIDNQENPNQMAGAVTPPVAGVDPRKVFVVHGRDTATRDAMFQFLRSLGLDPMEWEEMVSLTHEGTPYIGRVLEEGFRACQAVVVLLTGDDEARLREDLRRDSDPDYEAELTPQPRANVLFEAGMAMGQHPERTILVQVGNIRSMSDIAGRHTVRFDGSAGARNTLKNRLRSAGCAVNDRGSDWSGPGNFRV